LIDGFPRGTQAIKKGDVIRICHFLESGGDANLANRLSWTLLMMAALEGNTGIGEELIQRGAGLDMRNKFGDTALSLAAHTGHVGFVELLLSSGASLDEHPFGTSFESFLDWAAQYGTGAPEAMAKIRTIVEAKRESA
jgi:ankyrin repeat protein